MALIGDGSVTTIVGRLRDPYVCVDVDLDGLEGDAVTEHIAGWAEKTGLWVLTPPSPFSAWLIAQLSSSHFGLLE